MVRQSLRYVDFIFPRPPPVSMRSTSSLDRNQIREFRRGFRATDFLDEGNYNAFIVTFLMRPFHAPISAPAPAPTPRGYDDAGPSRTSARCDEGGPSRASAGYDEAYYGGRYEDGPTDDLWRVTVTDIYGDQFTHQLQLVPEVDSFGRSVEVSIGHIYSDHEPYSVI